jgi:sugar lactone lactonase YvrE
MKKTLLILLLAISFFTACKKNGSNPIPPTVTPVLSITSLNVNMGPYTTIVTITGTGFSATATNDQVFFNGKAATISAASSTQITATVPLSAGTGVVTVSVNNGTPVTGPVFTYQLSAVVSTLAGSGAKGNTNGTGTSATFNYPTGIAVDAAGNVYVADSYNNLIRKISPAGVVSTLAGSGTSGSANGVGTAASFYEPYGVAVDAVGNVYVADLVNNLIREITSAGVVTTFAGNGTAGKTNGIGTAASIASPDGIAIDGTGNLYVADGYNLIRKITSSGIVSTLAGSGLQGSANGTGTAASFLDPAGIAIDATGNLYVADGNELIRKITPAGVVTTFAGSGVQGNTNGTGTAASFYLPTGVALDAAGNVYVAELINSLIRKISPAGVVTTFAGSGSGVLGSTNGIGTAASFKNPFGIAVDATGNIYVADTGNNLIRKIVLQ